MAKLQNYARNVKLHADATSNNITQTSIREKLKFLHDWDDKNTNIHSKSKSKRDVPWIILKPVSYDKKGKCSDIASMFNLFRPHTWESTYSNEMQTNGYPKGGYIDTNGYWYVKNPKYDGPLFRHYFDNELDTNNQRIVYHELYSYTLNNWFSITKDSFALLEHDLLVIGMKSV